MRQNMGPSLDYYKERQPTQPLRKPILPKLLSGSPYTPESNTGQNQKSRKGKFGSLISSGLYSDIISPFVRSFLILKKYCHSLI